LKCATQQKRNRYSVGDNIQNRTSIKTIIEAFQSFDLAGFWVTLFARNGREAAFTLALQD